MEFKKIVAGALYYVAFYKKELAKALLIPFLFLIALDATDFLNLDQGSSNLVGFLAIFVQVIFAIIVHRIVLMGPDAVSKWGISSWTKRETYFFLHVIGLVLILIPCLLLTFIPAVGWLIAAITSCWLLGRLSLVFPGIAIDKGVSFKMSWELTKNHQLLMFLVIIVLPFVLSLLLLALPVALSMLLEIPQILYVKSLIVTFVLIFEIAALSMTYQLITSEQYGNS